MSSHTEPLPEFDGRKARNAVLWARIAPYFGKLAAALGLVFVAAFFLEAGFFAEMMPKEPLKPPAIENPTDITSYDSTLTGFDHDHQPYEVKATRGYQDDQQRDVLHLEQVTARFNNKSGDPYDVVAKAGDYDSKLHTMDLRGDVVISQGTRFTARMEKAHVLVKEKSLSSDVPVAVTLADGFINANALRITNDGANILFLNGVKARFGAKVDKGDAAP